VTLVPAAHQGTRPRRNASSGGRAERPTSGSHRVPASGFSPSSRAGSDRVIILDHGHLVAQSTLADLTAQAGQVVRIRTSRADELCGLLRQSGITATISTADRVEVTGASPEQIGTLAAEHAIPIFETTTEATSLEDVFFELTAAAQDKETIS
jgi:hypothetical protein